MDAILHLRLELPCTADEAFRYFADDTRVACWLAPAAHIEPVVGGPYEIFWDPADRAHNSTLGCKVTATTPGELLAFEWRGPVEFEGFMNQADPLTHVTVAFVPRAAGCAVHLMHTGWRSGAEWEQARRWFERAWTMAFQALGELVTAP
jgi:uncharacterized protein YndB with AHSA1/START domain